MLEQLKALLKKYEDGEIDSAELFDGLQSILDDNAYLQKLKRRLGITGDGEDDLLGDIIDDATTLYLSTRYPTSPYPVDDNEQPVLSKTAQNWVFRASIEMYAKMGAEGQRVHSELGINRSYEGGTVSHSLLREITPVVGVAN